MKLYVRRNTVIGFSVTAITVLPLSIFLTLHLQFLGSLLGFFSSGLLGGYLTESDRFKAFLVGTMGSLSACLIGLVLLSAVAGSTSNPPEFIMYVVSYVLWLNVGSAANLMIIVALIGGIGGIIGEMSRAWKKRGKKGGCS